MPRRRVFLAALTAILLVVTGCAGGARNSQPTSAGSSSNATSSRPGAATATAPTGPAKVTVPIKFSALQPYGGTVYSGCGGRYGGMASDAGVFDLRSGRMVNPPQPPTDPGTKLESASCAVTGTPDHLKIAEVVTTTRPAQGLQPQQEKTMAYVYDLGSNKATVQADISSFMPVGNLAGTGTGLILFNDQSTTVLSNTDLSTMWTAPRPVAVATDETVVLGSTLAAKGIEIRTPNGEMMLADPEAGSGFARLVADGNDQLIEFFRYTPGRTKSGLMWAVYDVGARAYLDGDVFPSDLSQTTSTLSDGKLFVHEDTAGSTVGMELWNIKTGQLEFKKTVEEYNAANTAGAYYFNGHLYLVNAVSGREANLSVTTLPDQREIATTWTARPALRLKGWTVVLVAEAGPNGNQCRETQGTGNDYCKVELIPDQNGSYPGPWF